MPPKWPAITAYFDGHPYLLERVRIEDLADWRERHHLVPAGTFQSLAGPDDWPILRYEPAPGGELGRSVAGDVRPRLPGA